MLQTKRPLAGACFTCMLLVRAPLTKIYYILNIEHLQLAHFGSGLVDLVWRCSMEMKGISNSHGNVSTDERRAG